MDPMVALLLVRVIDLIASGIELLPEANARKDKYLGMIRTMVEEDRSPTDAEWADLLGDTDDVTNEIRRIVAAKGGSPDGSQ